MFQIFLFHNRRNLLSVHTSLLIIIVNNVDTRYFRGYKSICVKGGMGGGERKGRRERETDYILYMYIYIYIYTQL